MTAFSTRNRRAALALLGGAAVITATSAGIATADPGAPSHGGERTTIICTDPGDGVPDLPPLPDTGFHDAAPTDRASNSATSHPVSRAGGSRFPRRATSGRGWTVRSSARASTPTEGGPS